MARNVTIVVKGNDFPLDVSSGWDIDFSAVMRSTVPWKGKHTKSDQGLTVEVRWCETGPVLEVTA